MKKLHSITLGLLLLAFVGGAQAIPLTNLFAGDSIIAGDKLFDNFTLVFADSSSGHVFNTDNIEVTALNDGGLDPGPGLRFDVLNNEFLVFGDGLFAFKNFVFEFRVTPLAPNTLIKDVSMGIGAVLGADDPFFNDNGVSIIEDVGSLAGGFDLASLFGEFSQLDGFLTNNTFVADVFPPVDEIWVTKDLFVWSAEFGDLAELTAFEQRFSQVEVPVPAPLFLMGIGLLAIGATRRRSA